MKVGEAGEYKYLRVWIFHLWKDNVPTFYVIQQKASYVPDP